MYINILILANFSDIVPKKKIQGNSNALDISSNGGLVLAGLQKVNIAFLTSQCLS